MTIILKTIFYKVYLTQLIFYAILNKYFFYYHEEFVLQNVVLNINEEEAADNNYRVLRFFCCHGRIVPLFYGQVCNPDQLF